MAPPFGLTCAASSGRPEVARHRQRLRGEGLVQFDDVHLRRASVRSAPAPSSRAGDGPKPMMRGARPAAAMPSTRARGFRPCSLAAASEASSTAQAPSLTPDALPAVTRAVGLHDALELGQHLQRRLGTRMLVGVEAPSGRPSSAAASPARSRSRRSPRRWRCAQRCWLRSANASWSAREMLNSSATFSAVSGIESMPYCAFISGLTKRQPIVVSSIFAARENGAIGLAHARTARASCSRRRRR